MSSIEVLLEQLPCEDLTLWEDIGTELRSEKARFSAEVTTRIPIIIDSASSAIIATGNTPRMVVRALVNLVADNDSCRSFLTLEECPSSATLWKRLLRILCDLNGDGDASFTGIIILLILQFFTYTESSKLHGEYFNGAGFLPCITSYVAAYDSPDGAELLNNLLDNHDSPIELQALGGKQAVELTLAACIKYITVLLEQLTSCDDADDSAHTYAVLIYNLSGLLKESPSQIAEWISDIHAALALVPPSSENSTRIKRNLFATIGIMSSLVDANNPDSETFIRIIDSAIVLIYQAQDNYNFAAACVIIGNCITTPGTHSIVKTRIEAAHPLSGFLAKFFSRIHINDPVQLQSIHILNNLVDQESAPLVMEHASDFARLFVKPAIDNQSYYPDTARLVFQLARKLLRLHFIPKKANATKHKALWVMLVQDWKTNPMSRRVGLLVLQAYVNTGPEDQTILDDAQFLADLFAISVSLPLGTLSLDDALETLKTLGMLTHVLLLQGGWQQLVPSVYRSHSILANEFIAPLGAILHEITRAGPADNDVFVNNARFLAAIIVKLCDQWNISSEDGDITTINRLVAETRNVAVAVASNSQTTN